MTPAEKRAAARAKRIADFKEKKIARDAADKARRKKNAQDLRLTKLNHKKLKQTRHRQELFRPLFTEGRASLKALTVPGKAGKEMTFTDEEEDKLAELVAMLTQKELLIKYFSWSLRAIALGISQQKLYTWRNSSRFQHLLVEAIRNDSVMATAAAMPAQAEIAADSEHKQSVKAFGQLAKISGVQAPVVKKGGDAASKITIESLILNLVGQSAGVKNAGEGRVIEEAAGVTRLESPRKRNRGSAGG